MLRKTLSFISVLLLGAGAAGAQNPETPAARPRTVGVVMSGGEMCIRDSDNIVF